MEIKAGIVGAGRIGVGFANDLLRWPAGTHLQAYGMVQGVALIAIAEPYPVARERVQKPLLAFRCAEDMLRATQLDIVSICTPPEQRREIIEQCVDFGVKAIFCEKPLAMSSEEAEEIVELCEEERVGLLVNCQRRFSPVHCEFSTQVQAGVFGPPHWGRAVYTAGLWNTCPHLVDLLCMYFGRVHRVTAQYSRAICEKAGDMNVDATLEFHNGLVMELVALPLLHYTEFGFSVYTRRGQLYTGNHGMSLYLRMPVPSTKFARCSELSEPVFLGNVESSTLIPLGIQRLVDGMQAPSVDHRAAHVVHVLEALQHGAQIGDGYVEIGDSWGLPGSR